MNADSSPQMISHPVAQMAISRPLVAKALSHARSRADADDDAARFGAAVDAANLLLSIDADDETLASALVVGTLDRGEIDAKSLAEAFGPGVAGLVAGVARAGKIEHMHAQHASTADRPVTRDSESHANLEVLRKMLFALADDVRVVLILLAERVVLMRGLTRADDGIRRVAATLTRDLYAPLANRLGVFQIKWELEDLGFRFLQPELYKRIAGYLDGKRGEREVYISGLVAELRGALASLGVAGEVAGRPKHIWSIHRKMQTKNLPFEKLYDVRAVRVLVESEADCYKVLGWVHDRWAPIAGEFDDYIAQPKANHYQSLHTAVIGPQGKTLEVQIRTHAMHRASEHGVAAHWRYKESSKGARTGAERRHEEKIAWIRQVLEWKRELVAEGGFADESGKALFNDTIYVLTPQDKVIDLPAGSTPVDFAYRVHTDLGHRCRGAKVDGHIVPLNTRLANANRVEIMAAKQGGPSRDWINPQLGFLASPRAQAKVRAWFRHTFFESDAASGRQVLERELARAGASSVALETVASAMGYVELPEFCAAIGRNEVSAHQIDVALRTMRSPAVGLADAPTQSSPITRALDRAAGGVLVLGVDNLATMVAKCCKPLPGDAITGFVTKNRGVTVHRVDCQNVRGLDADQRERLMPAQWGDPGQQPFQADLEVVAADRHGLLRDVGEAMAHERINVAGINTLSKNSLASMRLTVDIARVDQLERALRALAAVKGVESVRRR
jgi:GTP pyrophosphokinase